jgi:hypothetical protein
MDNDLLVLKTDILNVWEPERFAVERKPIRIGSVTDKNDFQKEISSCLDMPIKLPYGDIVIPYESDSVKNIIEQCVDFEKTVNPFYNKYYIYLTIHQKWVKKGETQRNHGAHFDGMQGVRYTNKIPVCHSYLVSDSIPTHFFVQPFPTDLDEDKHNWFDSFAKVTDNNKAVYTKPFDIYFMTAYNVHECTYAEEDTFRTFVRVEFSLKQFNRNGNSVNPNLESGFIYEDRNIPQHLITI